jgi:hypothetical protein
MVAASLLLVLASATGCAKKDVTLGTDTISPDNASTLPVEDTSTTTAQASTSTADATATTQQDVSTDPAPPATGGEVKVGSVFAIIGDYGTKDAHESAVAALVAKWRPAFIVTTGNNYFKTAGGSGTGKYDESAGAFFGNWMKDISTTGTKFPTGKAAVNSFFPALGTHDYTDASGPNTYLDYFTLPGATLTNSSGNERYYDFVKGPIHFFVLNSNPQEPDGTSATSKQALWLQKQLSSSTERWNIVISHHPPYSSDGQHATATYMRWPFADWGADAVISGRANTYERILNGGVAYMIDGLGGAAPRGTFVAASQVGSASRYCNNWGAQKVTISDVSLDFEFYNLDGTLVDRFRLPVH